ncbi:hypothetical protein [Pseudomonas sp. DSP3-2-2]|uniref:hypothetical protein n=1 Tax=unclassified Pseudomonas TaxID=196821 RepID=UPI003CE988C7
MSLWWAGWPKPCAAYYVAATRAEQSLASVIDKPCGSGLPVWAPERAIVEGDLEKLDGLIRKLDNVQTLDGRTPNEIDASKDGGHKM